MRQSRKRNGTRARLGPYRPPEDEAGLNPEPERSNPARLAVKSRQNFGQMSPEPRSSVARICRGGRGGAVGTAAGCGLAGDDRTWRGRRAALCALRQRRFCLSGQGARSAPLSVQGLREDIRRAHRHGAVGSAPQGALAVVRRVVGRRGDDTRVCRALRDLRRARRIAGATASWRRSGKRRTGLPGSSRPTRPSCLRAGRASGS